MICQVCFINQKVESHFGGVSCRACAAFFRRFVHSPKRFSICSCKNRNSNAHPCRHCRMGRCLAVGMMKEKVLEKGLRDFNASRRKILPAASPPPLSLLNCQIIPRYSPNIFFTIANWKNLENSRNHLYQGKFDELNFYEMSCFSKLDSYLIWELVENIFPVIKRIDKEQKDILISNFMPKWGCLDPAIDYTVNQEVWQKIEKSGEWKNIVWNYYGGSLKNGRKMSKKEVLRTFGPFWRAYYDGPAREIYRRKFDKAEFTALFLLIFFDSAYTNVSKDWMDLCGVIRKVILRELKGYQLDNNYGELRIIETVEALGIIEKAEEKFHEEVIICQLNDVHFHEDFEKIMKISKR